MPIEPTERNPKRCTRLRSSMLVIALIVGLRTTLAPANELFSPPAVDANSSQDVLHPLPPVCDAPPRLLDRRQNSLFPHSSCSPLESSLFGVPKISRPFGTPLLPPPPSCRPAPLRSPVSPGFQRSFARHSLTSPVPPAVVSAHAPPWEQLPSPDKYQGQALQATPHCSLATPHCSDSQNAKRRTPPTIFPPTPFLLAVAPTLALNSISTVAKPSILINVPRSNGGYRFISTVLFPARAPRWALRT